MSSPETASLALASSSRLELCWRSTECLRGAATRSGGTLASSEAKCTMAAALSAASPGPALHLAGAELVKQHLGQLHHYQKAGKMKMEEPAWRRTFMGE